MCYFIHTNQVGFFFKDFKVDKMVWLLESYSSLAYGHKDIKRTPTYFFQDSEDKPEHKENVKKKVFKSW